MSAAASSLPAAAAGAPGCCSPNSTSPCCSTSTVTSAPTASTAPPSSSSDCAVMEGLIQANRGMLRLLTRERFAVTDKKDIQQRKHHAQKAGLCGIVHSYLRGKDLLDVKAMARALASDLTDAGAAAVLCQAYLELEQAEDPSSWMESLSLMCVLALCDLLGVHSPCLQTLAWNLSAVCAHAGLLYRLLRGDTPLLKLARTLASNLFGITRHHSLPQWASIPALPSEADACLQRPLSILGGRPYFYAVLHGHQNVVMQGTLDEDDEDEDEELEGAAEETQLTPVLVPVLAENKLLFHALNIVEDRKTLRQWLARHPEEMAAGQLMLAKYPEDSDSDDEEDSDSDDSSDEEDQE
eukprot:CAMPEP_0177637138 /NCGR_PEP_ID=MMETSP0447-20121125/4812_1 /TAXON_ID=0 /ORGANISM="Stygamoeba regulata, Strain BSH-02190019" /LENGTH=352 /DNA_ID=CAMNT_0019139047 /DNA_START=195 /DNA_END=1253 /DNA_ORIENTATION=+